MSRPTPAERALLIEQAASAHRSRDARGQILGHPAFHDLDPDGRQTAFELGGALRRLEAALDPEGLSTTARAVLARITASGSGGEG